MCILITLTIPLWLTQAVVTTNIRVIQIQLKDHKISLPSANIAARHVHLKMLHFKSKLFPEIKQVLLFFQAFLQFLKKVVANEGKNKMNLWNVSMIVAPNLFIYKGKRANQQEMQAAATTAHIVRLLIRYQDILWTVSSAGSPFMVPLQCSTLLYVGRVQKSE